MSIQKENMINGRAYIGDDQLKKDIYNARRKIQDFNTSITREEIQAKAKNLFGSFGENS